MLTIRSLIYAFTLDVCQFGFSPSASMCDWRYRFEGAISQLWSRTPVSLELVGTYAAPTQSFPRAGLATVSAPK
jgi:hypothetical protein